MPRWMRYRRVRRAAKLAVRSNLVTFLRDEDAQYIRGLAEGQYRLVKS